MRAVAIAICLVLVCAVTVFAAGQEPVKIGVMYALSGPLGVLGTDQAKVSKIAADQINKDGGILGRPVELLIRDDEASPSTAARVARKLVIEDKVNFIVGANGSPAGMSVAEVASRFKTLYLSAGGAMTELMTGKNCNRYTFRINHSGAQFYRANAAYVASTFPDVKTVAGINPDYSYGHEMWDGFTSELKKKKPEVQVVPGVFVPMAEKDYTNYIASVVDKKPDLVYSVLWSGSGVAFVKQAKPYGMFDKSRFFLAAAALTTAMTTLGNDMVRMWGSEPEDWQMDNPMNKRMVTDWMKESGGKPPHAYMGHSYATLFILKQVIERVKSFDTEKVIASLEGGTFDTPWGKMTIRKGDHQAMGKIFIGEAKPDPKYQFWTLSNPKVIPAEDVSLPVSETGCVMK